MPNAIHSTLPRGSMIELINVRLEITRRDESPDADYIIIFTDWKEDVKVYVPMNPEAYREFAEGMNSVLTGVVAAPKPTLEVARAMPRMDVPKRNGRA